MVFARLLRRPRGRPIDLDAHPDADKLDQAPAASSPTAPVKRGPGRPKGVKDSAPRRRRKPAVLMPTRIVRRPPSRRGNPDLTAHQAGLIARFVQLLADRAEQRLLNQAFRLRCGRTTEQVRRNCPDVDVGRQAFRLFKVPPDRCLALPVEVRAFLRWVLSRHRCQVGALSLLVGGDPADWHGYVLLDGRRTIGPPEWHRIRKLVERLEAEPGACDDFAAILVDRLNRPANRSREAVDAEVLARVMQGPVIAAAMPPRAAFPRYTRHATGAA